MPKIIPKTDVRHGMHGSILSIPIQHLMGFMHFDWFNVVPMCFVSFGVDSEGVV